MNKLIQETAAETAKSIVMEFKKRNMLKAGKTPFQKTEDLLYNYRRFLDAVKYKKELLKDIKASGGNQKSRSIVVIEGSKGANNDSEYDKMMRKIETIERSIKVTQNFITITENALKGIKGDPYYMIIEHKYFEGKTHEDIAEIFDKDVSTITRNKKRLVNDLTITLFSDEVIQEIFM